MTFAQQNPQETAGGGASVFQDSAPVRAANHVSPFNWRSGTSQIAPHLVTPGWVPAAPKKKAASSAPVDVVALRKYRAEHHTLAQCAAEFGVSVNTIRKLLKERPNQRARKVIVTAEEIRKLRDEGLSWRSLARQFSCATWTLRQRLGEKTPAEVLAKVKARYAKVPGVRSKGRQISMTDAQYETFKALGGGKWLRSLLTKS